MSQSKRHSRYDLEAGAGFREARLREKQRLKATVVVQKRVKLLSQIFK